MSNIICLKTIATSEEAEMAKGFLNTNGIEAKIFFEGYTRAAMPFAFQAESGIKIMINEEDKDSAEKILSKFTS